VEGRVLAIVGPTATGKTPLAVAVAQQLGDAELINADSRQTIRGLTAGTCAPTGAELRGIPCHLVGVRDPHQRYSVADWVSGARRIVAGLQETGRQPIVVGGTGLYVRALLHGLDLAAVPADPERRRQRAALASSPGGVATLAAELSTRDPAAASTVDLRNPRRVSRALEILDARGGTLAAARGRAEGLPATVIGLDAQPKRHLQLITERAVRLLQGRVLLEEVDSALARGVSRDALERAGIGYREALAVRDGSLSPEQAIAALIQRTRRYAKAQRTWFRADPRVRWLERGAGPVEELVDEVIDALHQDARAGERLPGGRRP
jgi:tRNA dimethylallyltransferase